jgi:hypothetical protein
MTQYIARRPANTAVYSACDLYSPICKCDVLTHLLLIYPIAMMASHDGTNSFAPCCLGNNCRLVVDVTRNGEFPLAATSRHCVACNGVLHPLCGEIDSQSSLLTCFNCIEAYGRTFESQESAALFFSGQLTTGDTATTLVANDSRGGIDASEHERLVQETKRRMMPDECPRLNRSQSTKDNNRNEVVKLIMWLMGHHTNECSNESRARQALLIDNTLSAKLKAGSTDKEKRIIIRRWLDWEESPPPFKFEGLTYRDFTSYLSSNVRKNGIPFKGKVYMNKRSILNNLFKRHKFKPNEIFLENVDRYMEGVVRVVAQAAQEGLGSVERGKREITYEVYERIMVWFLEEKSHEGIFGRAFLALTWNLMCRGANTCICLKHLLWRADAFGISFSHVKNDPAGSRNWHPRHIYPNPDNYYVCCITAVIEYLLCFPQLFQDGNGKLFPGPKQEERFGTILQRVLGKKSDELCGLGYGPNDIGIHSIRKGAGTFASSGTTAAPSSVSVNNRGGWTLGGVRDIYMLYERAGDQYVGRILSGMNVLSARFGASAPDFYYHGEVGVPETAGLVQMKQAELDREVQTVLNSCFGELDDPLVCIRKTLRLGIASLLHHFDSAKLYHGDSPLGMSPIFRDQGFLSLRRSVRVIYPWENDPIAQRCIMKLTGVPPHVVELAALEELKVTLGRLQPAILDGVEKLMDDRTMGGTLSETRMKSMIEESRQQFLADLDKRIPHLGQPMARNDNEDVVSVVGRNIVSEHKIWHHKGKFRRVPPDWTFPKCGLLVAYKLWHTKDTVSGQCALKFLSYQDVDFLKDGTRRLEEFKFLMTRLDSAAKDRGLLCNTMTALDCRHVFDAVVDTLGVPTVTPTGRRRHLERTKWPTYLRNMRNKNRPRRQRHMLCQTPGAGN